MQVMPALRQFEHGERLSQRTLRLRHTTQLRDFNGPAEFNTPVLAEASEVSEFTAVAPPRSSNLGLRHYAASRLH